MSIGVISWVLKNSGAQGNDRVVLVVLADYAHDDGTGAYPSQRSIAHKAGGITDRCVRDCLHRLQLAGRIDRVGKHGKTIEYRVRMDTPELGVLPAEIRNEQPETSSDKETDNNPEDPSGLEAPGGPPTRKADVNNPESSRTQPGKLTSTTRKPASDNPSRTVRTVREPCPPSPSARGDATTSSPGEPEGGWSADVLRLCHLHRDLVNARTSRKRPYAAGTEWLSAMDRLLRIDGRSAAEVERVIRWVDRDSFERAVVLSVPKLRARFDELLLKANRHRPAAAATRISTGRHDADRAWLAEHTPELASDENAYHGLRALTFARRGRGGGEPTAEPSPEQVRTAYRLIARQAGVAA